MYFYARTLAYWFLVVVGWDLQSYFFVLCCSGMKVDMIHCRGNNKKSNSLIFSWILMLRHITVAASIVIKKWATVPSINTSRSPRTSGQFQSVDARLAIKRF